MELTTIDQQLQAITKLNDRYADFSSSLNANLLTELKSLTEQFDTDAQHAKNENRLLRIGIVGQIKRGKSSFLNSLLFDGQNVLPKAATPMTAALTKISYSEQSKALVEFYTQKEWQKVKETADMVLTKEAAFQQALADFKSQKSSSSPHVANRPPQKPQMSQEEESCLELVDMVDSSGINVQEYLDSTITLADVDNHNDLVAKLNDYVGANGKFTPIVKSTALHLNIATLKGIEVVDTPGMNDPIISRGRRTQEFIGQCDVVFLLSNCGQFLDMKDMGLLAQNIPHKGIEDIVLVGSLFDGALLDEYEKYNDISGALVGITKKLNQQASSNVERVCEQATQASNEQGILTALKNALPPVFISSRCFDLARKPVSEYSEEELHTFEQLNDMYSDFEFDSVSLEAIANFSTVNEKLTKVRDKKEQILEGRLNNLLKGSQAELKHKLALLQQDITVKRENLLEGDLDSLQIKQQQISKKINDGKSRVADVFENYSIKAKKKLLEAKFEIKNQSLNTKRVESKTGTKTESYSVCVGTERCGFLWLDERNVYENRSRSVDYTYANVHEAIDKLEAFAIDAAKQLYQLSLNAVSLDLFKNDIKTAIKDMFDFTDPDFDPEMILMPLNNAVERVTIPAINLKLDKHINTIRQQFDCREVEGDKIHELRNEQARVVALLLEDIVAELDSSIELIMEKMDEEEQRFVPDFTKDLSDCVEQLKQDIDNKEQALSRYDSLLAMFSEDLSALSNVN